MNNEQIAINALLCYNALQTNLNIIDSLCNLMDEQSKIIELSGVSTYSKIVEIFNDIILVLQANNLKGCGIYDETIGVYNVKMLSYITNYDKVYVTVATIDFSYFFINNSINWEQISTDDNAFMEQFLLLKLSLDQFKNSVEPFIKK